MLNCLSCTFCYLGKIEAIKRLIELSLVWSEFIYLFVYFVAGEIWKKTIDELIVQLVLIYGPFGPDISTTRTKIFRKNILNVKIQKIQKKQKIKKTQERLDWRNHKWLQRFYFHPYISVLTYTQFVKVWWSHNVSNL